MAVKTIWNTIYLSDECDVSCFVRSSNGRSAKTNLFTTPFLFLLRIFENFAFDKSQKNDKQSVISCHVLTYELKINFNDFIILSKDFNNFNLLIKESL